MFKINFYEKNGKSPVYEFLEDLRRRKDTNKDAVFFFFFNDDGSYVLLHQFRKKTQKALLQEIKKTKRERDDYIFQKKG